MARDTINQDVDHALDTKKGWFQMASLDLAGKLHEDVEFELRSGRVAHVAEVTHQDDNGTGGGGEKPQVYFKPGAHNTGPACFVWTGSDRFDVSNPGLTAGGRFVHKAIAPGGNMNTLVAFGAYELETTEFDTAQTYLPNQLLTARQGTDEADEDEAGRITNQRPADAGVVRQFIDPVVGVVSTGEHLNHHRVSTLAFWTAWLPGAL